MFSLMSLFDYQDKNPLDYFVEPTVYICVPEQKNGHPTGESKDRINIPAFPALVHDHRQCVLLSVLSSSEL